MAYVLMARDHCTPVDCAAFRSLGDTHQIASNMDERIYESLITRYAPSWNAPATRLRRQRLIAALPPSMPTGKPTNAEFPTAASTPPVNIMTPEPALRRDTASRRAATAARHRRRRAGTCAGPRAGGGQEADRSRSAPARAGADRAGSSRAISARQCAAGIG